MRYEPDADPDPHVWLAADEHERQAAVDRAVAKEHLAPEANPRMHALVHVAVETQVAQHDPPEVAATLERLRREGLGRHEALHAIGMAFTHELFRMLNDERVYDGAAYKAGLAALSAEAWRKLAEGGARLSRRRRRRRR